MKKLFAAIAALTAVVLLASCSGKDDIATTLSYEQELSSAEASSAAAAEKLSSVAAQRDVIANEIGKTIPNKKIVMCVTKSNWYQYEVIYFDEDAIGDYKLTYYFYNTAKDYEDAMSNAKNAFENIQEKDKDLLMIVDKKDEYFRATFIDCYSSEKSREDDMRIVIE